MNSGLELRAAVREDRDGLAGFLSETFKHPAGTFFIRPEVLDWKYFQPRSAWKNPRSWIIKSEGQIVAHAGVWPLRIPSSRGIVDCLHAIDWAAAPEFAVGSPTTQAGVTVSILGKTSNPCMHRSPLLRRSGRRSVELNPAAIRVRAKFGNGYLDFGRLRLLS